MRPRGGLHRSFRANGPWMVYSRTQPVYKKLLFVKKFKFENKDIQYILYRLQRGAPLLQLQISRTPRGIVLMSVSRLLPTTPRTYSRQGALRLWRRSLGCLSTAVGSSGVVFRLVCWRRGQRSYHYSTMMRHDCCVHDKTKTGLLVRCYKHPM